MSTTEIIPAPTFVGYDVIRTQRGQRSVVLPNLPRHAALTHMRNLKRRAIDGHTNVYFEIAPHTA